MMLVEASWLSQLQVSQELTEPSFWTDPPAQLLMNCSHPYELAEPFGLGSPQANLHPNGFAPALPAAPG